MNRSKLSYSSSEFEEINYFPQQVQQQPINPQLIYQQQPMKTEAIIDHHHQYHPIPHHSDQNIHNNSSSLIVNPLPPIFMREETNLLMENIQFFDSYQVDATPIHPFHNYSLQNHQRNLVWKPNNKIVKKKAKLNTSTRNLLKYVDPEYRRTRNNHPPTFIIDENVQPGDYLKQQ